MSPAVKSLIVIGYLMIGFVITLILANVHKQQLTFRQVLGMSLAWPFFIIWLVSMLIEGILKKVYLVFLLLFSMAPIILTIVLAIAFIMIMGKVYPAKSAEVNQYRDQTYLYSYNPMSYTSIPIKSQGFKCYTVYRAITRKSSLQYKLQRDYAYTGNYGIRMVNGRYCVAVGTAVTKKMGQYIDVVLENGLVIHCIACDQKSDKHTKKDRITTAHNGCVCEFYLDYVLPRIKECGDVSKACPEWQSPVCEFRVFDTNVFEEE